MRFTKRSSTQKQIRRRCDQSRTSTRSSFSASCRKFANFCKRTPKPRGRAILGWETVIGAGSTIGANVFLLHSVPANSLVVYEEVNVKISPKEQKAKPQDFQI